MDEKNELTGRETGRHFTVVCGHIKERCRNRRRKNPIGLYLLNKGVRRTALGELLWPADGVSASHFSVRVIMRRRQADRSKWKTEWDGPAALSREPVKMLPAKCV